MSEFRLIESSNNSIKLLKLIRNVNFKFEDQTYVYDNIYAGLHRIVTYSKNPDDDLVKHRDRIKNRMEIVEQFGNLANTDVIAAGEPRIKELQIDRTLLNDEALIAANMAEEATLK